MRTPEEAILVVYRPGPGLDARPESPATGIPVLRTGRPEFLVLLRSPEDHGYWHLVAGGIEQGEEPAAAALRELGEETGLLDPLAFAEIPVELGYRRPGSGVHVRVHSYAVEAPAGWEPTLNEEHVDYRWLSAEDARELLEFPEPRDALLLVARRLEERG